ncbi:MAG: hypothetical protein HY070_12115 [Chloroflexi bacterium]|nr:hypothetical protein [Chloroflexota bacterium]MBI3742449.1 hypothetical protein [Chloroflexota bacterium]
MPRRGIDQSSDKVSTSFPLLPSRIGKRGVLVLPPDGKRLRFEITGEIRKFQSDLSSKIIVLERVRFDDGRIELRLAYYIIGKKPRMQGKWVWGQYATFLPAGDFAAVVNEAQKLRWF